MGNTESSLSKADTFRYYTSLLEKCRSYIDRKATKGVKKGRDLLKVTEL